MKLRDRAIFNGIRKKILVGGLHKLHDVLAETSFHKKYWVCGGALLGWARSGNLLKHDTDVDFHFWEKDRALFEECAEALVAAGFKKVFCFVNIAGEITEYVLQYKFGTRFEFFTAHKAGDKIRSYCYGGNLGAGIPESELLLENPYYDLEEFQFLGRTWLKPADHEQYLTTTYGNWKIPDKNYHYYNSDAIISRKPLPGQTVWPANKQSR